MAGIPAPSIFAITSNSTTLPVPHCPSHALLLRKPINIRNRPGYQLIGYRLMAPLWQRLESVIEALL